MLLKILVFCLTCLLSRVKMQKFGDYNFTSEWMIYTRDTYYPPMVTKLQESLLFVTFPLNFSIRIESSKLLGKPCEVPVTQLKKHRNKIVPVYAEGMENDSVLIAILEAKSKKETNSTNAWLYVIDVHSCSYDFTNFTLDAPLTIAKNNINIIPYKDSFDIFVKSDVYCEPAGSICNVRYGSDLTPLNDYDKLTLPYEDERWDLMTKRDYDPSDGYLYMIMSAKQNGTILRYYDSKFGLTREICLNYDDSLVYWYEDSGIAATCFRLSDQELECMLLDVNMGIELAVNLYYDSYLQYYSIIRLCTGEALVFTILSNDPVGTYPATYVQLIGRSGEVTSPVKFQEYVCESVFEINTFKLREGLFCVSTTCSAVINNKCIGTDSELEF